MLHECYDADVMQLRRVDASDDGGSTRQFRAECSSVERVDVCSGSSRCTIERSETKLSESVRPVPAPNVFDEFACLKCTADIGCASGRSHCVVLQRLPGLQENSDRSATPHSQSLHTEHCYDAGVSESKWRETVGVCAASRVQQRF